MLAIIQSRTFVFLSHTENLTIKIYKNVILPVVPYECET